MSIWWFVGIIMTLIGFLGIAFVAFWSVNLQRSPYYGNPHNPLTVVAAKRGMQMLLLSLGVLTVGLVAMIVGYFAV